MPWKSTSEPKDAQGSNAAKGKGYPTQMAQPPGTGNKEKAVVGEIGLDSIWGPQKIRKQVDRNRETDGRQVKSTWF